LKVTKGIEKILNNPFSVLGLPCNAEKIDIIKAQEKLNKLEDNRKVAGNFVERQI